MVSAANLSPFARHGIEHLSASSLNTYAAEKGFWCLKYLFGFRDSNASMWRGLSVEAGLDEFLYGGHRDSCHLRALNRFDLEGCGLCDDFTLKERSRVPAMLECAMQATQGFERPTLRQFPIEYWFEGIEVPIKGVIDYEWETHGIDLKTVNRMPSEIPGGHARQISLYQVARKKPYKLLYVTEKRSELRELSLEETNTHLKRLEWQAHAIRRVLAMFSDKHDVAKVFVPDFDHFYWKSEESKRAAAEVWNVCMDGS